MLKLIKVIFHSHFENFQYWLDPINYGTIGIIIQKC